MKFWLANAIVSAQLVGLLLFEFDLKSFDRNGECVSLSAVCSSARLK
uniref:F-box domain-containing protein n=1 Tax=Parascaris univalens TaxID=6257 RepID=A0A915ARN4_PARUN